MLFKSAVLNIVVLMMSAVMLVHEGMDLGVKAVKLTTKTVGGKRGFGLNISLTGSRLNRVKEAAASTVPIFSSMKERYDGRDDGYDVRELPSIYSAQQPKPVSTEALSKARSFEEVTGSPRPASGKKPLITDVKVVLPFDESARRARFVPAEQTNQQRKWREAYLQTKERQARQKSKLDEFKGQTLDQQFGGDGVPNIYLQQILGKHGITLK